MEVFVAEPAEAPEDAPKKRSKLPLLIGLVLFLTLGGGAFYAVWSGLILGPAEGAADAGGETGAEKGALPDLAFVPVDPVVISLGPEAGGRHLRFSSQLEVAKDSVSEVTLLMPRILDVLNSYLRAISVRDVENPSAMAKLRAQMLRRVQIVTGEGRVRDLLVTEFVLN